MSGTIIHEPGFMEVLLHLPLVRYQGFMSCAKILLTRVGKGPFVMCWDWEEPGSCLVPPRGAGSAWPCCCAGTGWAVLVGGIDHRGSSGCKYRLGQCEIGMAIRSCQSSQDTRKALCSSLGMLSSLAHGGRLCQNHSRVEQVPCLTQNLVFLKLQLVLI